MWSDNSDFGSTAFLEWWWRSGIAEWAWPWLSWRTRRPTTGPASRAAEGRWAWTSCYSWCPWWTTIRLQAMTTSLWPWMVSSAESGNRPNTISSKYPISSSPLLSWRRESSNRASLLWGEYYILDDNTKQNIPVISNTNRNIFRPNSYMILFSFRYSTYS